jgi:hypothetical protein
MAEQVHRMGGCVMPTDAQLLAAVSRVRFRTDKEDRRNNLVALVWRWRCHAPADETELDRWVARLTRSRRSIHPKRPWFAGASELDGVRASMEHLPPRHRTLAGILVSEEITISEAARRLNMPTRTAHTQWTRIRRFVAHVLGEETVKVRVGKHRVPALLDQAQHTRPVLCALFGDSIRDLTELGLSPSVIAREFGLDRGSISQEVAGSTRGAWRRTIRQEAKKRCSDALVVRADIEPLLAEGLTYANIARQLGIDRVSVSRLAKGQRNSIRRRGRVPVLTRALILELSRRGVDPVDIAHVLSLPPNTVRVVVWKSKT